MGPELVNSLGAFARLIRRVRQFFDQRDFVEVFTPTLVPAPDPALHIESFLSELRLPDGGAFTLYLSTSPEFQMKRMVSAGCERIYQIAHFFRNGEMTPLHNPEFVGVEWYQVGSVGRKHDGANRGIGPRGGGFASGWARDSTRRGDHRSQSVVSAYEHGAGTTRTGAG